MPGGGDGGAVAAIDDDDMMQCSEHPFKSTSPGGGICAFCLQEKLGKLVSSSSSSFLIQSSSSSSPSFRSDLPSSSITAAAATTTSASLALSLQPHTTSLSNLHHLKTHAVNASARNRFQQQAKLSSGGGSGGGGGARIPFLLTQKKKKKSSLVGASSTSPPSDALSVLKRSKSTTAPRSARNHDDFSNSTPRRSRGFWSFLHLPSSSSSNYHHRQHHHKKEDKSPTTATNTTTTAFIGQATTSTAAMAVVDEVDDSPNSSAGSSAAATSSFGRKVSRSRSVGCGSRSFSGDFFERISTGFGDCTLRRVESQREGSGGATQKHRHSTSAAMREKVRCGGLFGGFMMITSSSSSSTTSSSSYWAAGEPNGRPSGPMVHGRAKSWGWAFASPRRAFGSKAGSSTTSMLKDGKGEIDNGGGDGGENNNKTPNLAAIPSLLSVRS